MIDIKLIRENPKKVQEAAKNKGVDIDVMHVLEIDHKYRELSQLVQRLREKRNRLAKEKNIEAGRKLKDALEKEEHALKAVEDELQTWVYKIPNIPKPDVKVGKDESENEVIRKYKKPKTFSFTPKDHVELGKLLDIIDVEKASKTSGARFGFLKNDAVLLEFALVQFAFEVLLQEGFIPIIPPVLIKPDIMRRLGYMEHGADEDMFIIPKDELVLIGTAEHAIVAMHKDEILQGRVLPLRYVGFSTAFRKEAGSYGKDTRGIFRVHQFDKIEMVSFVAEGKDDKEHEYLLSLEEKLFKKLDFPYQVVKMCTGDVGFPAARKYDIEAWIPSQEKFRELTSVSTVTDFQSRRLNIKYQESAMQKEKKFVFILNGTAFAIGRTLIAILENYQQEDGSVLVPKVLQKYIGKTSLKPQK